MNDHARELLVAAALRGDKQIKESMHDGDGDCALGVLHASLHETREAAITCKLGQSVQLAARFFHKDGTYHDGWCQGPGGPYRHLLSEAARFGLSEEEACAIATANDRKSWDFLTIARKFDGPYEEAVVSFGDAPQAEGV